MSDLRPTARRIARIPDRSTPEGIARAAALVIELGLLDVVPQSNVNRPNE